jgi:branched-chain amino acid transport system permease protein
MSSTPAPANRLTGALADAFKAALLTLVLSFFILGFQTVDTSTGLELRNRWWLAAIAIGLVFAGRLALNLFWWSRQPGEVKPASAAGGLKLPPLGKYLAPVILLLAISLPFAPFADRYIVDVATLILTYVMLGWGLNIVVGLAGLLDLGYVAFYAVGAYSFALLATTFDWSFWVCLPLAGILAASWGITLGFPVLRLRGDYLAIVTLAFGEIIRIVLMNWYTFTKGPDGISGIPRPTFFGLPFKRFGDETFHGFFNIEYSSMHRIIFLYYIILALALITNFITLRLRRLPVGRAWEAMREDEIACRSLGINTTNTKLTAFAIGAMFGGFAGSFFATRQGFISPESFTFIESAIILAIVVLGGMGSQIGVVIASVVMIGGIEVLRNMDWVKAYLGSDFDPGIYRMLLFGLAMVIIMVWKPQGIISRREPTVRLGDTGGARARPDAEGAA